MQAIATQLENALAKKVFIVLLGECTIEYDGRAQSFLPPGERLIIIKEDASIIVHKPTGNSPVNYMKPGVSFKVTASDDELLLQCSNESLKEFLMMTFSSVVILYSQRLIDSESLALQGSERHYADYLFEHPELIEEGFTPLSREEHTKFGFIDIFGYDHDNTLVVIECKRFKAGPDAVTQLRRYVERIKRSKGVMHVRGMIVAPDITKNALAMLVEYGFAYKKVEPPHYLEKAAQRQKRLGEY